MTKYHYEALVDLILGCTATIIAGLIYNHGETYAAYAFTFYGAYKLVGFLRNEMKAKRVNI